MKYIDSFDFFFTETLDHYKNKHAQNILVPTSTILKEKMQAKWWKYKDYLFYRTIGPKAQRIGIRVYKSIIFFWMKREKIHLDFGSFFWVLHPSAGINQACS